jgi:hypothetical protein
MLRWSRNCPSFWSTSVHCNRRCKDETGISHPSGAPQFIVKEDAKMEQELPILPEHISSL